ncbi:MAG: zinc metallopeptidase [Clostridia bacterium]|nr:zinc metallopeptidase [Clostridia bacterium]MBR2413647.1 zinc metallopeptidase [Clostridia bacterium]MBR3955174.1 zinc metallopeptidase [Clostridia bacterium]
MYFDPYYLMFVVPAFLLALGAQILVKSTYKKMSKEMNARGVTGAQAAMAVLRHYGITDVRVEATRGKLTDHYDPKNKVIRLSEGVYNTSSVAAVGIAAHEAGHAAQHAQSYAPIRVRNAILPVCNIASYAGIPLAMIGFFLGFEPLIIVGLALYSAIAVFQLVTLPVEFNASGRALAVINETGLLGDEEKSKAAKVLRAAAMTYVASLAVTLANLLRFVMIFLGGKRRR